MADSATSQTPTSDRAPGGESSQPEPSQLEAVAKLLRGDEDDAGGKPGDKGKGESTNLDDDGKPADKSADDGKPGESPNKGKPKNLTELAERIGVEVKDLFDIELNADADPGGDDFKTVTLGQLKDQLKSKSNLEVDRLQFEETKTKREADFLRAHQELNDIIAMLPKQAIKPELVRAVTERREQLAQREHGLTLTAIPEWKDEAAQTTDRTAMREHLGAYGYPSNYLDSVTDHRTLKYIRDNMRRQQRINAVLEQVKSAEKPGHRPSGKPSRTKAPTAPTRNTRSVNDQVAAVSELLNG